MVNTLRECIKRLAKGESKVKKLLQEDEKYIKMIYVGLIQEIRAIGIKAPKQNFMNILGDLKVFIGDLNVLKNALPENHKIHRDIDELVKRIYNFIDEYQKLGKQGLFTNPEERLKAFLSSMENALKNTILGDLAEKDTQIRRALEDLKKVS